jgi:hypothetical protein
MLADSPALRRVCPDTIAPPPEEMRAYPLGMVDRPAATILGPSVPCESGRLALLPERITYQTLCVRSQAPYSIPLSLSEGELSYAQCRDMRHSAESAPATLPATQTVQAFPCCWASAWPALPQASTMPRAGAMT